MFGRILVWLVAAVDAASLSTPFPMCPCMQTSSFCLPFDKRFQAHTLDDALKIFPDLSISDRPSVSTVEQEESECQTEECHKCRAEMRQRLEQVGLLPTQELLSSAFSSLNSSAICTKYRFSSETGKARPHGSSSSSDDDDDEDDEEEERDTRKFKRARIERDFGPERYRRQVDVGLTSDGSIVGQRFVISCTSQGQTTDAMGRVSLCSSCWVWRQLPANFSPRYVNELICDNTSIACLSGYATCSVGFHSIDVVRNDSGVLTTLSLDAGAFCECRVAANSAITSLVMGTGLQSTLPPVTSSG